MIFLMPLGIDLLSNFNGFLVLKEGKLAPKSYQKSISTSKGDFWKIVFSLQRGLDFSGFGGTSWEEKPIKNQTKNEVQDGMHLGIDFWRILVDLGCQVGRQNQPIIHPKRHRKNNAKKKGTKMANNTLHEPTPPIEGGGPEPWGGGRGREKSFPEGEEGVVRKNGPLNHPSPEGWWDFKMMQGSAVSHNKILIIYFSQTFRVLLSTKNENARK